MELERVDRETAERRLHANDRQREEHICRAYGVDPLDPDNLHLRIDSTAIGLDTCADLIVAASQARMRQAHSAEHG